MIVRYSEGLWTAQLWKDERGWHYDGPTGFLPRSLQGGAFWRGSLSDRDAASTKRRMLKAGAKVQG